MVVGKSSSKNSDKRLLMAVSKNSQVANIKNVHRKLVDDGC